MRVKYLLSSLVVCFVVFLSLPFAQAEAEQRIETPRFILYVGDGSHSGTGENLSSTQIANQVLKTLASTNDELSRIFNFMPERKVVLRFLSPTAFQKHTGAPSWTSAMYFHNEISLQIEPYSVDIEDLRTAARHEYVHAFLAAMTKNHIPAWLDEGLAQIIEGEPNPILAPALRNWIYERDAIPLNMLHDGFTTLHDQNVPVAYAQSLFVTRTLINQHGMKSIVKYLRALRNGDNEEKAFSLAFSLPQDEFEEELTIQIDRWAKSGEKNF